MFIIYGGRKHGSQVATQKFHWDFETMDKLLNERFFRFDLLVHISSTITCFQRQSFGINNAVHKVLFSCVISVVEIKRISISFTKHWCLFAVLKDGILTILNRGQS